MLRNPMTNTLRRLHVKNNLPFLYSHPQTRHPSPSFLAYCLERHSSPHLVTTPTLVTPLQPKASMFIGTTLVCTTQLREVPPGVPEFKTSTSASCQRYPERQQVMAQVLGFCPLHARPGLSAPALQAFGE